MTLPRALRTDRRAAVSALSHALTLGMTSLLILALLLGATGFLDSQRSVTARDELETIGNRLGSELGQVDELGTRGGAVNLTASHPDRVAGSTYDAQLRHDDGVAPTECADVSTDTCLVLTTAEFDIEQTVPIRNDTNLSVTSPGGGEFRLHSEGATSTLDAQFTAVDMSSRIGVGQGVERDSFETLATPGNDPPIADFDFTPDWPEAGNQLRLDARDSYDPDGNITEYRWDLDDDGFVDVVDPDPFFVTTLPAGRQNITLEVKDDGAIVSNFTREIDVSGLSYEGDLDTTSVPSDGVSFTVNNTFATDVEIQKVRIDPEDNSIGAVQNSGGPEVSVDPSVGVAREIDSASGFTIYEGGRILDFTEDGTTPHIAPEIPAGEEATVRIGSFPKEMDGERISIGLEYTVDGSPNATIVNDTVGGPEITNYTVFPNAADVDLEFDSSEPLTGILVQLGGDASGTLTRSDFTETGSGPYHYRADVSSGTVGTFWARMDDATSLGTATDDTPLNDTAVVTGTVTWQSPADWDNALNESGLVHASFGDHVASHLSLGYPQNGSGLVGYWPLDSTTGAVDTSPEGNDGTINGSPSSGTGIGVSSSYQFDPTSGDFVEVPNDPSLQLGGLDRVTVSAWVNIDTNSQSGWRAIVQHSDESFNMQFRNGDIPRFTIHDDGSWVSAEAPSSAVANRWYHYVGTYDGSEIRFYVDGVTPPADTATVDDMDQTSLPLGIAENIDQSGRKLDGKIDEVRIYNRALAPDEVQDLYFAATQGRMLTNKKVDASGAKNVSNLELQYETANPGETIEVKVHGAGGEESNWISVPDGTGSIPVSGLSTDTDTFQLEIRIISSTPTQSPVIDRLGLT